MPATRHLDNRIYFRVTQKLLVANCMRGLLRVPAQVAMPLGRKADRVAQKCRIRALLQKRAKGHLVVGHRGDPLVGCCCVATQLYPKSPRWPQPARRRLTRGGRSGGLVTGLLHHYPGRDPEPVSFRPIRCRGSGLVKNEFARAIRRQTDTPSGKAVLVCGSAAFTLKPPALRKAHCRHPPIHSRTKGSSLLG